MLNKQNLRTEEVKAHVGQQRTAHSEFLCRLDCWPAPAFQRPVSRVLWRAHMTKTGRGQGAVQTINETWSNTLNQQPEGSLAVMSIQGLLWGIKKACLLWIPSHYLFTLGGGWAHMLLLSKCLCQELLSASDYLMWCFNSRLDRSL